MDETCDGTTKSCPLDSFQSEGTRCGADMKTECTDPDTCDGAGSCLDNHAVNGAGCGPMEDQVSSPSSAFFCCCLQTLERLKLLFRHAQSVTQDPRAASENASSVVTNQRQPHVEDLWKDFVIRKISVTALDPVSTKSKTRLWSVARRLVVVMCPRTVTAAPSPAPPTNSNHLEPPVEIHKILNVPTLTPVTELASV
jgi:hypothetical protein